MSPRRRLLLAGVLALTAVLAVVIAVRIIAARRLPADPPDQARPGVVLLVPGYGGGTGSLNRLADRLRAAGRTAIVVAPPGDGTGDLRVQADNLDRAVRDALADGAPSVDIVGYSAGGVVTRLWLDRHDGATRARRIVTLGSPLHGAQLAAEGAAVGSGVCPPACQQLAPGSSLLAELNDTPLPAAVPWLSIWTENDQTVQPPDSARLDGAVNLSIQKLCPDARISHSQLPTDPLVTTLVLRALGTGPINPPNECASLSS